jgi:hypothetical protein
MNVLRLSQAMALVHEQGRVEVACNLLNPWLSGPEQVQVRHCDVVQHCV